MCTSPAGAAAAAAVTTALSAAIAAPQRRKLPIHPLGRNLHPRIRSAAVAAAALTGPRTQT